MGTPFVIAGHLFRRRSIIKLSAAERATLERTGTVVLARPVEWPLPRRAARMDRAYVDPGGTDVWGPGPYLKVPNTGPGDEGEVVNRVFCPWGYPPDSLRAFRRKIRMRLEHVEIVRVAERTWEWRLTAKAGLAKRYNGLAERANTIETGGLAEAHPSGSSSQRVVGAGPASK